MNLARRIGRRIGSPLALQIVALLLGGLVVAQVSTLALTLLLPPKPAPEYHLDDVARALRGGPLKVANPRPLIRLVSSQPPSLQSAGWMISERSRESLAKMTGASPDDVRLLFYTPLPLVGAPGATELGQLAPKSSPKIAVASFAELLLLQPGGGGPPGGGGFGGGGFGGRGPSPPPGGFSNPLGGSGGSQGGGPPGGGVITTGSRIGRSVGGSSSTSRTTTSTRTTTTPAGGSPAPGSTPGGSSSQGPAPAGGAAGGAGQPGTPAGGGVGGAGSPASGAGGAAPGAASGAGPTAAGPGSAVSGPSTAGAPGGLSGAAPGGPGAAGPGGAGAPGAGAGPAGAGAGPGGAPGSGAGGSLAPGVGSSGTPTQQGDARRRSNPAADPPTPAPDVQSTTAETRDRAADLQARRSEPGERVVPPLAAAAFAASDLAPSGPVLRPADRGGYLLPSGGGEARGLFGLAPSPFVQGDFVAALRLAPGRWVIVQPEAEPFPNIWQRRVLLWFLLSSAIIAPIGILFARRLAAPLGDFAEAAERLGRDPSGATVPLRGPAEIGRAARAFNGMQARLKRYIDDRTAMVGAISHDLRTPLARMRFRLEEAPAALKPGMLNDIGQMEDMISAVLAFIRDATEPSVRERVDLRSILECVVDDATLVGGEAVLDPGERLSVEVDTLSVQRVLTNLVDNALKYGDRARVRIYEDGGDVVAEVEDGGPGLPEEELEKVFLPFYRSDQSRNLNKPGIGLGLAVSRSIARAHGGDVRLANGADGLRAQLRLPKARMAA